MKSGPDLNCIIVNKIFVHAFNANALFLLHLQPQCCSVALFAWETAYLSHSAVILVIVIIIVDGLV